MRLHGDRFLIRGFSRGLSAANKLAVIPGIEIDNLGDFKGVAVTHAAIRREITRLFNEGVRYVFPIHLLDNPFGGTAVYQGNDLMNYSTFRENGHWWNLGMRHQFQPINSHPSATGILGAFAQRCDAYQDWDGLQSAQLHELPGRARPGKRARPHLPGTVSRLWK